MVTQELLNYVHQRLGAGVSKDAISWELSSGGWTQQDINEAFAATGVQASSGTPQLPQKPTNTPTQTAPPVALVSSGAGMLAGSPGVATTIAEPTHTATVWRRLCNVVIDLIFLYIFYVLISVLLSPAVSESTLPLGLKMLFGWSQYAFFYVFFESIWQRTPGKWITKTKVVKLDGTKPGPGRIFGRFLCRCIPFEALSFLFGEYPYGWHDRISKTMVVPATYTVEEAASVNPLNKGKTSKGLVIFVIGFLVVLPILGIVSSIVLVSIHDASQMGADARVRADMADLQAQATVYQSQNNSFQGFCASVQALSQLQAASKIGTQTTAAYVCNDSTIHWAASVPLRSVGYSCVDDSGQQPLTTSAALDTQISCTGSTIIPQTVNMPAGWQSFNASDGSFSILLPSKPTHNSQQANGSGGITYIYNSYLVSLSSTTAFIIVNYVYSSPIDVSNPEALLKKYANAFLNSQQGSALVSSASGSYESYPSLDFLIQIGSYYYKGRFILVNQIPYMLAETYAPGTYDDQYYQAFINSFRVH